MPTIPFTSDNAAEMAKRAAIARKRNSEEKQRIASLPPVADDSQHNKYVHSQLSRTRKQIDLLNDMLESKSILADHKAVKSICDAKARLYEVEAALAGRPKPGQLRPVAPSKPKRSYTAPSSGPVPEPVQAPDTTTGSVPDSQTKPSS